MEVRLPSGHVAFDPARISSRGMKVELPGVKLAVAGEVPTNLVAAFTGPGDGRQKPIKLDLTGSLDAALLARIAPTLIADARGAIEVAGKVSGTADNPHLDAEAMVANGKGVTVVTRGNKTQPAFRIAVSGGQVVAKGKRVSVSQLAAVATPGGELVIGPKGRPAELDLVRLYPAEIARISLPVVGRGLNLDLGWMRLDDGRLDLKLSGDPRRALALGGEVELGAGRVSPTKRPPPPPPAPRAAPGPTGPRPAGPAPTPIMLDVRVKSDGERFVVDPGWLPDVHLGLNVKVGGTLARPAIAWDAEGRGIYSTIALWLFRMFS
jgi:hypothetical protein